MFLMPHNFKPPRSVGGESTKLNRRITVSPFFGSVMATLFK
ncbi:hypothetical protein VCHA34P120_20251 [Vibrio chagasii]|nr:hypothetical protein VCHA28FP16_20166 [Vibrio chagasii]CAH6902026.1 hypothetical protein VCHA34P120_20251 [Vibrio chagasii]